MKKLKYITVGLSILAVALFYSCTDLTPPHGGWLWVVTNDEISGGRGSIMRLDPATGEMIDWYRGPASVHGKHFGVAFGNGLVWVTWAEYPDYSESRYFLKWLDPITGEEGQPLELEYPMFGLCWAGDSLWGAHAWHLYKINIYTGEFETAIPLKYPDYISSSGLAWDGSYFWVSDYAFDESRICKIDPNSGEVLKHIKAPCKHPVGLAWDGAALWVNDEETRYAYRVSPKDGDVLGSYYYPFDSGKFPYGLAFEFPDGTGN